MKTIMELKKKILVSKKENIEISKAYAAILKQVESATIGVKNAETNEEKLILSGAKKELKEQEQSKSAGAPFSETVMNVCQEIVDMLSPKVKTEAETITDIQEIIESLKSKDIQPNMKEIMTAIKATGNNYDMKSVSGLINKLLNP